MAEDSKERGKKRVTLAVSTAERPQFEGDVVAYAFDRRGELLQAAKVASGQVRFDLTRSEIARARVFLAPAGDEEPTVAQLERRGAYEPVLTAGPGGGLVERFDIPGDILDHWPLCSCWVRGRVLRASDNRPVCDARVHICEVDRVPFWILRLPDDEVLRLRDDLVAVLRDPPFPRPLPDPPFPFPPVPGPGPDPAPIDRPIFRFGVERATLRPEAALRQLGPQVPGYEVAFNPQPDPPARPQGADAQFRPELLSPSVTVVRETLAASWKLIVPWLCYWPHWWWRFRCDELRVVTTDAQGRFETRIWYPCAGDHPDLYFWVEYDFGSGFETVHRPPIACHTYWNYSCGSEVTIRATDPRLPGCGDEPDLPGCQVVVTSIGNGVSVREIQTAAAGAAHEGLTATSRPFGGTLEPRIDFSRTQLIDGKKVPYYRWSYRRLSGPDGVGAVVDAASVPIGSWTPLTRAVHRHYKTATSYPSDPMGPVPPVGGTQNLFRIRPAVKKIGTSEFDYVDLNEHVDLATGYFETAGLTGAPGSGPTASAPAPDDLAAGRYELKLELFDDAGQLVNWTAKGIDLKIVDADAPFGTTTLDKIPAPAYNRITNGAGDTLGFRMVLRVDNNRCYAEVLPVAGDLTPDPLCGFHEYAPGDDAGLSFLARHPNGFATYGFTTRRATGGPIAAASTSGVAGEAGNGGFSQSGAFTYGKDVPVAILLGACANAAFSERLEVYAMAVNGYHRIQAYDHADTAAFALAQPCPPCECEEGSGG